MVQVLGALASIWSVVLWWPQVVRVWAGRSDAAMLAGVSVGTQVLLVVHDLLWGAYAVAIRSFWVGAPGLVSAPLAVMAIVIIVRARRRQAAAGR